MPRSFHPSSQAVDPQKEPSVCQAPCWVLQIQEGQGWWGTWAEGVAGVKEETNVQRCNCAVTCDVRDAYRCYRSQRGDWLSLSGQNWQVQRMKNKNLSAKRCWLGWPLVSEQMPDGQQKVGMAPRGESGSGRDIQSRCHRAGAQGATGKHTAGWTGGALSGESLSWGRGVLGSENA